MERREWEKKKKKKRKRKRRRSSSKANKVWKLNLSMELLNLSMDLWFCMIIIFPKPRVFLGFHLNPKIMESKVGKTLNSIIRIWNPSFEDGFMV